MVIVTESASGAAAGERKIQSRSFPDELVFAGLALLFGVLDASLLLGWHRIDPSNLAWLTGDSAQYQTGWEFLRRQPWTFPPTWLGHLDYPFGISAAYLDVIPIVAVPLHLFARVLPSNFQYLGSYAALCLILQSYFGLRLLSCFSGDRLSIILGALFFPNSTIMLMRLYGGHFSLCSQWLIVGAIYCYFRPVNRVNLVAYLGPFVILAVVASGITPYIAIMVLFLGLAALVRSHLERSSAHERSIARRSASATLMQVFLETNHALWFVILIGSTAISFVAFGFLVFGGSPTLADQGYGVFSMNLLSPLAGLGRSSLPELFHVFPNQEYEGYNYLGLGLMLLCVVAFVRYRWKLSALWSPSLRPLVIASALLTVVALSIRVTAGQRVLFILPVPLGFFDLLAVFRSSGRFFWPVWYLIALGAITCGALTIRGQPLRRGMLAAALAVQTFDTLPLMAAVAERSSVAAANPLRSPEWVAVARTYKHLVILPARQCDAALTPGGAKAWPFFASFAAKNGLTLNSVYAARVSSVSDALNCTVLPREIAAGQVENDTAYVLNGEIAGLAESHARTFHCSRVDGFNLCTDTRAIHSIADTPSHPGKG